MASETTSTEATTTTAARVLPGVSDADFADAVQNPASFSVPGLSQSNRSLSDLITADKYLRKRALMRKGRNPLSGLVSHIIPPGTCDR